MTINRLNRIFEIYSKYVDFQRDPITFERRRLHLPLTRERHMIFGQDKVELMRYGAEYDKENDAWSVPEIL